MLLRYRDGRIAQKRFEVSDRPLVIVACFSQQDRGLIHLPCHSERSEEPKILRSLRSLRMTR
jgi:hypothetical protein